MKTRLTALFALLLVIFVSCKEDSTSPDDNNNTLPGTYMPMKIGYWWKYNAAGLNYSQITYTVSRDTLINEKKWFILTNDQVAGFVMHRFEGTVLMMKTMLQTNDLEYKLFDDKGKVGDSLITTFTSNNIPFRVVCVIIEKGTAYTVLNKEYKDVLKVQVKIYSDATSTGWKLLMREDDYFAKNIGPIKVFAEDFFTKELLEYSLK